MKPIPSIVELQSQMSDDFRNKLNLSPDDLKKTINAFDLVISAQLKLLYLFLADVQNNVFPDTANTVEQGGTLERQGLIYLNRLPFPDSIGVFEISVAGVASSVLRSGLTFKSNDDAENAGQLYVLDTQYTLTGSGDTVQVRSLGSGSDFNLLVADKLTITEPVIGVDKTVVVSSIITQPISGETTEIYREAILSAIQLEPQGGAKADYRQWATDAQGVRLVFPKVRDVDAGIVDIFVEATLVDSSDGKGTPTAPILADVLAVIEQDPDASKPDSERGRRPIQANVQVSAITLVPVDIEIVGLDDDSVSVKSAITSSLEDAIYDIRPFVAGAQLLRNKNDIIYSGKVQGVVTDTLTDGNFFNTLSLSVDGGIVTSYEFDSGNIPYLRNLTYV